LEVYWDILGGTLFDGKGATMQTAAITNAGESLLLKLDEFAQELTPEERDVLAGIFTLAELKAAETEATADLDHSELYAAKPAHPLLTDGILPRLPSLSALDHAELYAAKPAHPLLADEILPKLPSLRVSTAR
jgi:hypothetical protein